ncbi:MAG: molecular chaperone DnaJ, partial [Methanobacteriota archaeon]
MDKRDYYDLLGISRDASPDEIKSAFRQAARKHHPDLNPGNKEAEERFKEINEAYQVLSDREKRASYDQFGHAAFKPGDFAGSRAPNFDDLFRDFGFGDIFEAFAGRSSRQRRREGADIRYDLEITLEEAAAGVKKTIEVPRAVVCDVCGGSGAKAGHLKTCSACGGTGEVRRVQQSPFGQIVNISVCRVCGGRGTITDAPCEACKGAGRQRRVRAIEVAIPKGVDDGLYLRVSGEGEAGERGAPPGDLYVVVHVQDHPIFERQGADLFCKT